MMMGKGSMMDGKGGMNSDKSSKMNGKGGKDGMDGKGSDKGGMKSVKGRPPAPRLEGGNATNTTSFGIGSSTLEDDDAREQFADVLHLTNVSSSNVTDSPVAIGSSNTLEDDGKNRTNAKDDKNVHKQFADVVLPTNSSDKVTNAAFGVGRSRTSEHNGENRTIERDYNNARKKVFVDVVLLTNSLGNVTNPTVESEKSSASEQDGEHKTIVKAGTAQTQFADVVLSTNSSGNRSSSSRSSVSESSARNADTTLRNDDGFDVKILDDDQPVALASGRNHDA